MFALSQATKLMSVVANKPLSTSEMINIELSKAYLYRALRCRDASSDSIYCLVNVYLAVLHYTAGNYCAAIDHCTRAMISQDHVHPISHDVLGKLLPKIDYNIDTALGLSVFYQHLKTVAVTRQKETHVGVFTDELFAFHLRMKCLSAKNCRCFVQMPSADDILRYREHITAKQQLLICDVLVVKLLQGKFEYKSHDHKCQQAITSRASEDTPEFVELLQLSAIEHLTTYRQIQVRDFGSVVTVIPTDFRALHAYKRGYYQQCLQLCTQYVHLLSSDSRICDVPICPQFIYLLDDDIVSLVSLIIIVNPKYKSYMYISQLTLLLYLMTQCQIKLRHSVTSMTPKSMTSLSALSIHQQRSEQSFSFS